ncbi:MAG: hypothetical protein JSS10_02525 [Verrucomicrobia bacterium]|nr:hypothetical protein [Verrucomicrobiota bacterium]
MLSAGMSLLTIGGTVYTAYQAFHQDDADRQTILLSAIAGLVSSLFLHALAGTFSKDKLSFPRKIFAFVVKEFSSVVSGAVLPAAVATGYLKKAGEFVSQHSFGAVQVEHRVMIGRWEIDQLYPFLVGGNFGFMVGQSITAVYRFVKNI